MFAGMLNPNAAALAVLPEALPPLRQLNLHSDTPESTGAFVG